MNIIAGEMDATKEHFLPHGVKQSLSIPLGYRERLQPGAMVHLGIRPEHIEQVAQAEDSFKVYVEVVEPLGAETLVYASYGAGSVVYKVSPHSAPMVGDELFVRPKADNLHFFDPNTGQAIC
jgi:multiple sugar transport system ATP-binding protein